jgi:hypothetical protein
MKHIKAPGDVPTERHFAVLIYKSTSHYVEGDERSRTNPGHGYPGGYETRHTVEHWVTTSQAELATFVFEQQKQNEKLVFFEVPKLGKLNVKVDLGIE